MLEAENAKGRVRPKGSQAPLCLLWNSLPPPRAPPAPLRVLPALGGDRIPPDTSPRRAAAPRMAPRGVWTPLYDRSPFVFLLTGLTPPLTARTPSRAGCAQDGRASQAAVAAA